MIYIQVLNTNYLIRMEHQQESTSGIGDKVNKERNFVEIGNLLFFS